MQKELKKVYDVFDKFEDIRKKYKLNELKLSFKIGNDTYTITKTKLEFKTKDGNVIQYSPKYFKKLEKNWNVIQKFLRSITNESLEDLVKKQNFYYPVCDPHEL